MRVVDAILRSRLFFECLEWMMGEQIRIVGELSLRMDEQIRVVGGLLLRINEQICNVGGCKGHD
jgi:hypothetical protein